MLFYLINEAERNYDRWNDVETSLGFLELGHFFDMFDDIKDKDGDVDLWKTSYRNEDLARNLVIPTLNIQKFFSEWVNAIDLNSIKQNRDFNKLVERQDQFLTFNYTETLEEVYNIKQSSICHIHGKQNEEIYFGHGNTEDYYEKYMQNYIGAESSLSEIDRQLRKRTEEALQKNLNFFKDLSKYRIDQIYSFGFSFSEVDSIYLEEICKQINTRNVTWYFNGYDIDYVADWSKLLRSIGYKGGFNTFHVNSI
jgi:hypothetical protein